MRIDAFKLSALIGMAAALIGLTVESLNAAPPELRIVGYLPEYRMADFDLSTARSLTDLIVFSAEPTPEGELNIGFVGDHRCNATTFHRSHCRC